MRFIIVLLLSFLINCIRAQPCEIIVVDANSAQVISDVHVFFDDKIVVSNKHGRLQLPETSKDESIDISTSHLSYESQMTSVNCGDTIHLKRLTLSVPEVTVISKLSKLDLNKFYRMLRTSIKKLTDFEGKGIAENTVHYQNQIGEYKSFIFNYTQQNTKINDVTCINSFHHIRSDTIRYFENVHRLMECVHLGIKKRQQFSLLNDFLFERKSWLFEAKVNVAEAVSFYKFSRNDELITFKFIDEILYEISFLRPKILMNRVEKNGLLSKDPNVAIKIACQQQENGGLFINELNASVDIESGLLNTQVYARFEPTAPYRESIVSALENLGDEYLIYLLLDIPDPLVDPQQISLPNKQQIHRFLEEVPALSSETLLAQFGVRSLSDTSQIDTSLKYGKPIRVRHDGGTFIEEYFNIKPLIALHAIVYQNHITQALTCKLLLDPASTRFIQFYDSYYNKSWRLKQIAEIKVTAAKMIEYLSNAQVNMDLAALDDEEWGQIALDLEQIVSKYLKSDLEKSFASFKSGQFQNIRLNTRF